MSPCHLRQEKIVRTRGARRAHRPRAGGQADQPGAGGVPLGGGSSAAEARRQLTSGWPCTSRGRAKCSTTASSTSATAHIRALSLSAVAGFLAALVLSINPVHFGTENSWRLGNGGGA